MTVYLSVLSDDIIALIIILTPVSVTSIMVGWGAFFQTF